MITLSGMQSQEGGDKSASEKNRPQSEPNRMLACQKEDVSENYFTLLIDYWSTAITDKFMDRGMYNKITQTAKLI